MLFTDHMATHTILQRLFILHTSLVVGIVSRCGLSFDMYCRHLSKLTLYKLLLLL